MCGIAGYWWNGKAIKDIANNMALSISSRGPDSSGLWVSNEAGLALAHRRLSIIEVSSAGHQPMSSRCERYTLIFNGEIYNHRVLRKEIEEITPDIVWHGQSDTETLLTALSSWGIIKTLRSLNGMFAFALWDSVEKSLFLARDRMGEKPLYFGRSGNIFLFGSELKALAAHPSWDGKVNRDVLVLYMRHSCVPCPHCIYEGFSKVPPAHFVVIRNDGRSVGDPQCYWHLAEVAKNGSEIAQKSPKASSELASELDDLLREAVGSRMASDVPLGAFLSGGYDSTMVAAQMQAQSARSVKTFSIGFHDKRLNEAHHAKAVALELTDARMIRGSGVDLDEYPCLPEPEGKPVVVMVARLLRDKGAFEFVQAAQQLVERNVPVNMRLVGSPDLGNPTSVSKHDLESWKQAGVVELLGHVAFP